MEQPSTIKFLPHKEDSRSSSLDQSFAFQRHSRIVEANHLGAPHARMNTPSEHRLGIITPGCEVLSQLVPADALQVNRSGGMVVPALKPAEYKELVKLRLALEGLPFSMAISPHCMSHRRTTILKLDQPKLLVMHVRRVWGRIGPVLALMASGMDNRRCITSHEEGNIAAIGYSIFEQARKHVLDEIFTGISPISDTVFGERAVPPNPRAFLSSRREKFRPKVNPVTAMLSWKQTSESSYWDDCWQLAKRIRKPEQGYFVRRTLLYVRGAVGSPSQAL